MKSLIKFSIFLAISAFCYAESDSQWMWKCMDSGSCERHDMTLSSTTPFMSLAQCKLTCSGTGSLWPLPTGAVSLDTETVVFNGESVRVRVNSPRQVEELAEDAAEIFKRRFVSEEQRSVSCERTAKQLSVYVQIETESSRLELDVDESYTLTSSSYDDEDVVRVDISAITFFGARHALETLSQLTARDDVSSCWIVVRSADISDAPAYQVRALTIDTSRNFMSLSGLRRTIDAMSWNKLNTLHWHISDSHSFPLHVPSEPRLTKYGAYSPQQTYSPQEVQELVEFARHRGVRLLPELDGPAHAGFGWQWGPQAELGDLVVCLNKEPWQEFCVEPPCGQMNVINENLYPVLDKILTYYNTTFQPDMFHFGGDEVNINCWKSTPEIYHHVKNQGKDPEDDEQYMNLWVEYQKEMLAMWNKIAQRKTPVILWTSHLTEREPELSGLDPTQYIIQVWTTGDDKKIGDLLQRGYRVILSNYDAWYLDCGFSAWVGKGNNWCSPYKSWQTVYDNSPRKIVERFVSEQRTSSTSGQQTSQDPYRQILGGSAALWSEQADDATLDTKLWPRGAALAERLWTDPDTDSLQAEHRFVHHRRRMVDRGVMAETVQPQYCHQYEGRCYVN